MCYSPDVLEFIWWFLDSSIWVLELVWWINFLLEYSRPFKVIMLILLRIVDKVSWRINSITLTKALHASFWTAFLTWFFLGSNVSFDSIQLKKHCLDLNIIILPEVTYLWLKLIYLLVLLFLSFYEYNGMIERLFIQMVLVVFAKDFYLATEVVIRTFHKLKLAHLPVAIKVLSLNLLTTFVVAINYFQEASLVMG